MLRFVFIVIVTDIFISTLYLCSVCLWCSDVDSMNHFPDDFDDIPASRRNDSARARRRNASIASYNRRDSTPRVSCWIMVISEDDQRMIHG
jgi:hypothetical protein